MTQKYYLQDMRLYSKQNKEWEDILLPDTIREENKKATKHDLDGFFVRIERDGKHQYICLSDMTLKEREKALDSLREANFRSIIHSLCNSLYKIGEQRNIYGDWSGSKLD